eukprot:scaffold13087_cov41-Attheya_sp.AAC.1
MLTNIAILEHEVKQCWAASGNIFRVPAKTIFHNQTIDKNEKVVSDEHTHSKGHCIARIFGSHFDGEIDLMSIARLFLCPGRLFRLWENKNSFSVVVIGTTRRKAAQAYSLTN